VNGLQAAAQHGRPLDLKRKGKKTGEIMVINASVAGVESITDKLQTTTLSSSSPEPAVYNPSNGRSGGGGDMFLEYVEGGCQLNVVVAMDFTGSNGDPRKPGTLHYLNPSQRNDYEKAISAIVSILGKYDSDKQYPVWGFGAKFDGEIQHCFQCGDSEKHSGVKGVLDAYHSVFKSGLVMSGPTVFEEVIRVAARHATQAQDTAKSKGGQCYTVLLILTDGAVSDVQATARSLEEVSGAPLSVVIVGVGNADFSGMKFLDNFSGPGKRDIVQFVEFNKFKDSSHALTQETLNEIPAQLSGYFQSMNIPPSPPIGRADSSVIVDEEEEIDLSLDIGEDEIVVVGGGDDFVDGFVSV
jgi:hypothetical protein